MEPNRADLYSLMDSALDIALFLRNFLRKHFTLDNQIFSRCISIDLEDELYSRDCLLLVFRNSIPVKLITPLGPWIFGLTAKVTNNISLIKQELDSIFSLKEAVSKSDDETAFLITSFRNAKLPGKAPFLCREDYYDFDLGDFYDELIQYWILSNKFGPQVREALITEDSSKIKNFVNPHDWEVKNKDQLAYALFYSYLKTT